MAFAMRLIKAIEQMLATMRWYAEAPVTHTDFDESCISQSQRDLNLSTVRAVLDCVIDQVREDLLHAYRVDVNEAAFWSAHVDRVPGGGLLNGMNKSADQIHEVNWDRADWELASFESRHVEQLFGEFH